MINKNIKASVFSMQLLIFYSFEELPRRSATSNKINTAAPTIQTHGEAYQLLLPPPLLMSTFISAPLSCANNEIEINKERIKKATLVEMFLISFMIKSLIKIINTKVMPVPK